MVSLRSLMNEFRRTLKAKLALAKSLREAMAAPSNELERLYGRDMKVAFVPSVIRKTLEMHGYTPIGSQDGEHSYRHQNGSSVHIDLQDVGHQDPHMHWEHRHEHGVDKGVGGFDLIQQLRAKSRA